MNFKVNGDGRRATGDGRQATGDSKERVAGKKISINSGTRRITRKAHRIAFLRIYVFGDFMRRSTSLAKSRAISGEAMAPNVHKAKPTTNCVELFKSLQVQQSSHSRN
uniref:Uncharacterized protein n=1 Tax=Glossina pallidipes TaxID=7398 RepID=A0A1A9ZII9_GLOPL